MKGSILGRIPILPLPYFLFAASSLYLLALRFLTSLGETGTVLGLRGTGDWSTSERPENFRQQILLQFPNSPISLTALMSKLKTETTDDPEFHIFTKQLPTQRALIDAILTSGATTLTFSGTTPTKVFKKGHALIIERTLEVVWVVADPVAPYTSVEVVRGKGSTAAATVVGDGVSVVGTHHQEGAAIPTAISYDPTEITNWTQIFRTAVFLTNTARATKLRTGSDMLERQRETLEIHAIEREMAYIFGTGVEDVSGAQPERTTKGFISLVTSNVTDFADAMDIDTWESFLEDVFEDGSNEKLLLSGNTALTVINKVARIHGEIQMTPTTETYGLMMDRYRTPYGYLMIRQHPLFSKNATFRDWGIVVDTQYLVDRTLNGNGVNRDTNYLENRQSPGDDATKDEWLTESGLELQFESVNGVFKNCSTFVP
jgi:Family of unknown function (DUF5309)